MNFTIAESMIIKLAKRVIDSKYATGKKIESSVDIKDYLKLNLTTDYETFNVIYLNNQNQIIQIEEVSRGTYNRGLVFPREIVKTALTLNAARVILAHNHPSGIDKPSQADLQITKQINEALKLIDASVLDHIITGIGEPLSFTEKGLL